MRKIHLILLLFVSFFINVNAMYSSVETFYTLKMDKIYADEITEVEIMILTGGSPDKTSVVNALVSTMSVEIGKPISLYQSESYLKANFAVDEKINIKVLNANTELPVYMRQYVPGGSNEVVINTSRWCSGHYDIVFTDLSGEFVAKATIYID